MATDRERRAGSSRFRRASDGLVSSPPKRSRIDADGRDSMLDLALQAGRISVGSPLLSRASTFEVSS